MDVLSVVVAAPKVGTGPVESLVKRPLPCDSPVLPTSFSRLSFGFCVATVVDVFLSVSFAAGVFGDTDDPMSAVKRALSVLVSSFEMGTIETGSVGSGR